MAPAFPQPVWLGIIRASFGVFFPSAWRRKYAAFPIAIVAEETFNPIGPTIEGQLFSMAPAFPFHGIIRASSNVFINSP